ARGQETREHLHRRRLAAAVRAEEAEDLAAPDPEADVVDGDELAEALRQILGLDRDLRARADLARRDRHGFVSPPLLLREERDEGGLERVLSGPRTKVRGRAGGENRAVVHRDQPIEAARFLHI